MKLPPKSRPPTLYERWHIPTFSLFDLYAVIILGFAFAFAEPEPIPVVLFLCLWGFASQRYRSQLQIYVIAKRRPEEEP